MHRSVIVTFGNLFRALEAEGHFDHLNEVDIYCLHYIFVPRINQALSSFVEGWNNHSVSTEGNQTPYQMFLLGLMPSLSNSNSDSDSDSEEGSEPLDLQSNDAVSVPRCSFNPCPRLQQEFTNSVDPLSPCRNHGRSLFLTAIRLCGNHLTQGCDNCTQCD